LQYDFPSQEIVIQFVIEAIQAEAFNPKTLFLIGSYTIGNSCFFYFGKFQCFYNIGTMIHKSSCMQGKKDCLWRLLVCFRRKYMLELQNYKY